MRRKSYNIYLFSVISVAEFYKKVKSIGRSNTCLLNYCNMVAKKQQHFLGKYFQALPINPLFIYAISLTVDQKLGKSSAELEFLKTL
jgi:hypothetical protein